MRMLRLSTQALRAMAENKTRTFLMMLGVIIGVATLTVIASSVLGARADVMGKVEKFGLDQLMVMAGSGRKPGVPQTIPTTLKPDDAQAMMSEIANVARSEPSDQSSKFLVEIRQQKQLRSGQRSEPELDFSLEHLSRDRQVFFRRRQRKVGPGGGYRQDHSEGSL